MPPKKNVKGFTRPPAMRTPPAIPTGPRIYRPPRDKGYKGGPGPPPAGFVGGTTSATEWVVYWAMSKVFGLPQNPRIGPFFGEPSLWGFQVGSRQLGGAVIDFVVYPNKRSFGLRYAFRIQTERFHNYASSETQAYDLLQSWRLSEYNVVVDLYDYEFLDDPTGGQCIVLIKRALAGELWSPPGNTGIAMRVRPGRRMG